jgi:hypothetical protein
VLRSLFESATEDVAFAQRQVNYMMLTCFQSTHFAPSNLQNIICNNSHGNIIITMKCLHVQCGCDSHYSL